MKKPRKPKPSDTPSTDAIAMQHPGMPVPMVPASFARDLERDCAHWQKAAIEWMNSWKDIHARITQAEVERDEAVERCNKLNRRLTKAEGIIAASGIVENRPRKGSGGLGRALANYAAEQFKQERDQWRECAEELVAACTLHYGGDDSENREKSAEPFLRIMRVVERINRLGKQDTETPAYRNTEIPDSDL